MMGIIAIAIDGPAGAGKSTIAKLVAKKLGVLYVDTGAMYRAITLEIADKGIDLSDISSIEDLLDNTEIVFDGERMFTNGTDVSDKIRSAKVNELVSPVSAIPEIRKRLVKMQRNIALEKSVVMDGRDIGTNVLKDADIKIYLTASPDERARRRCREMAEKGVDVRFDDVRDGILNRDRIDSGRKTNPLRKADDAFEIDTTDLSVEEVADRVLSIIKARC